MKRHHEKFLLAGFLVTLALLSSARLAVPEDQANDNGQGVAAANASQGDHAPNGPDTVLSPPPVAPRAAFLHKGSGILPRLQVEEAVVADLETGETYLEINSGQRWPMASITKLMTASYAADTLDLDRPITLTTRVFAATGGDTTKALGLGEAYSGRDLMTAMLTFSSNEAAEALAGSKDRSDFLLGMNSLAKSWGLLNTNFSDPTGLSAANQSTALDLISLAQHVHAEHPELLAISRHRDATLHELTSGGRLAIANINVFAGRQDFIGGKTGFTEEAQGNLLSIFSVGGRPVVIVVLGTTDRFGETQKLLDWFRGNFIPQS
jgi:D-alanyl-D-alanine carboxypeptidase